MAEKGRRRQRQEREESEPEQRTGEESVVHDLEEAYGDVRQRLLGMFELPDEFVGHLTAARREFLLAIRSLIDARIEDLEQAEKRREAGRRGRIRID